LNEVENKEERRQREIIRRGKGKWTNHNPRNRHAVAYFGSVEAAGAAAGAEIEEEREEEEDDDDDAGGD